VAGAAELICPASSNLRANAGPTAPASSGNKANKPQPAHPDDQRRHVSPAPAGTHQVAVDDIHICLGPRHDRLTQDAKTRRAAHQPTTGARYSAVITVPDEVVVGLRTVLYLTVYICANQPTCSTATGALRLRVKVGLLDPGGSPVAGARQVTVYDWSVVRG
jgi:hypothetical protein